MGRAGRTQIKIHFPVSVPGGKGKCELIKSVLASDGERAPSICLLASDSRGWQLRASSLWQPQVSRARPGAARPCAALPALHKLLLAGRPLTSRNPGSFPDAARALISVCTAAGTGMLPPHPTAG